MHIYLGFNNDKTSRGMTLAVSRNRIFKINIQLISVKTIIVITTIFLDFSLDLWRQVHMLHDSCHMNPSKGQCQHGFKHFILAFDW